MEEQVIRLDEIIEALKKKWLMIVSININHYYYCCSL